MFYSGNEKCDVFKLFYSVFQTLKKRRDDVFPERFRAQTIKKLHFSLQSDGPKVAKGASPGFFRLIGPAGHVIPFPHSPPKMLKMPKSGKKQTKKRKKKQERTDLPTGKGDRNRTAPSGNTLSANWLENQPEVHLETSLRRVAVGQRSLPWRDLNRVLLELLGRAVRDTGAMT